MPIPDTDKWVAQVSMAGTCAAGGGTATPIVNVYHFRRTATTNALSAANVGTAFQTMIGDVVLDGLNADYTQSANVIRFIDDADDLGFTQTQAGAGQVAGDRLQSFVAAVIRLKASIRSRNYMGSKHYAPLSEADIGDDVLSGAAVTRWQAVRDAILAGFTDSDANIWVPCVVSAMLSQLGSNPTTVARSDVVQCILNLTPGTMRRRKVKTVV